MGLGDTPSNFNATYFGILVDKYQPADNDSIF